MSKPDDAPTADMSRAVDIAYWAIRNAILRGELKAGDSLPEKDLAERVKVSRTPVREALTRLRSDGLVVMERYRQHLVARFEERDVAEVIELRGMLEGRAAARAATRISPHDLSRLRELNQEMENTLRPFGPDSQPRFIVLNAEFHNLIRNAAESPRINRFLESSLDVPFNTGNRLDTHVESSILRAVVYHYEIISALQAGHSDRAEAQMHAHILSRINVEEMF